MLEKWTFDLRAFPVVEKIDRDTTFEKQVVQDNFRNKINIADLEAQFRAVLSRIASASGRLTALPKDTECSFTVSIEVRDDADRPVGRLEEEERKWIAAEPEPWNGIDEQRQDLDGDGQTSQRGPAQEMSNKTVPVRRLEAGELRMEVWVEESRANSAQERVITAQP